MAVNTARAEHGIRAWMVWTLAAAGFALAFFLRVSPSVMGDDLMREFAVGAGVLGNLSAIYFYIYAGSQIVVGAMMDRWGPRLMIAGSIALGAAGTALFAIATDLSAAYLGRFLIGAGSACAFVGSLTLAGRWFAPNRYAFMSGLTMLCGMTGGLLGQAPLAHLVDAVGWRDAMLMSSVFAAGLAVAVWLIVRDRPPSRVGASGHGAAGGAMDSIRATLSKPRIWCVMGVGASFSGPLLAFGGLWGVPYFMVKYGLDRPDAAFYVSLNLIGWAIGAPLGGWLSDHLGRRKAPLVMVGLINLLFMGILFYVPGISLELAAGLVFGIGLIGSSMVICYALARELTPPSTHGTVTGFINTGTVGAGAILQPVIGVMLDIYWDGSTADGVRIYSLEAYNTAFISLLAASALGLTLALMLRETYCRQQVE